MGVYDGGFANISPIKKGGWSLCIVKYLIVSSKGFVVREYSLEIVNNIHQ